MHAIFKMKITFFPVNIVELLLKKHGSFYSMKENIIILAFYANKNMKSVRQFKITNNLPALK